MSIFSARLPRHKQRYPQIKTTPVSARQADSVRSILQAKLRIGAPNDRYEREADHIADRVMQIQRPEALQAKTCSGGCHLESEKELETNIQTKPGSRSGSAESDAPASVKRLLNSPGKPLGASTRSFFEPRFARDFSDVRVHIGKEASSTAREINARAFTLGRDLVFADGEYQPDSHAGRHLLAHELTHVVQQGQAQPGDRIQRLPFGIQLPSGMRFLDSTEEGILSAVYGSSLNFSRILLSDGLGGGGRPFTLYMNLPLIGGVTVIQIGSSAYATPGSNPSLLIHEAAHSWQSQHHPSGAAYMANSIASQAGASAAGASAYCYVPGKWFGLYGAEQIAEQAEDGISAIRSHMRSVSAGSTDVANVASLAVPRWEVPGGPGVSC
ncbi:MAG: DUF4157 domain-containing protein [Chromatiaceae bacterium]|nr:DUF4157 domain-containing protein [Chromatiaceae bacterium]